MTLATPTRSGEQDYPQPSEAASKPTAADIQRLADMIPMLTSDPQYDLVDMSRWLDGWGPLQPLADAVLAASIAGDNDALEDALDILSDAMVQSWRHVPARNGDLRLVRHAQAADVANWDLLRDHDSSRPVLSLSRDGDSTQRWYVPSAAGLLVVEVAT